MKLHIRRSADRGHNQIDWLDARHSFSFGNYYDPNWMGFGPLRVINEDRVKPGAGFSPHGHANMEIITVILAGALSHKDSLGNGSTIRPGDVQRMSAGHGIEHSEFNASESEPVHLLQIWIQPDRVNSAPSYAQKNFAPRAERGGSPLTLLVRSDKTGATGDELSMQQDAQMYRLELKAGEAISWDLQPKRRLWIQMTAGELSLEQQRLSVGDGCGVDAPGTLGLTSKFGATALLFDLP